MLRFATGLFFLLVSTMAAAEPPISPTERARMLAEFTAQLTSLDQAISEGAQDVTLYSRRGDCHLFLGQFARAVADFEKMIALAP
ncbi:MAG: hypothetical protein ABIO94_03535, partial [Opitutaceae bacterium]